MEISPGASKTKGNNKTSGKKLTTNEATRHTLATVILELTAALQGARSPQLETVFRSATHGATAARTAGTCPNNLTPTEESPPAMLAKGPDPIQQIFQASHTKPKTPQWRPFEIKVGNPPNDTIKLTLDLYLTQDLPCTFLIEPDAAVNVYKEFIPDHARLRTPLVNLLKRDVMWVWDDECQKAFTNLKENLTTHPTLHLYQEGLPCQVYCNTSTFSITGVLKQVYPDGKTYTVQHFSRSLRSHERNYSDLELQCLAIVESVDNFRTYLMGRKFTIFSDHPALQWLKEIKAPSGRLFRWRLRLSRYEYEVRSINGVQQYETGVGTRIPFCGFLDAPLIQSQQSSPPRKSRVTIDHNKLRTVSRKGVLKTIVPSSLTTRLLKSVHTQHHHPNISKMTRLISAQYYWQNMTQDIAKQVKTCPTCRFARRIDEYNQPSRKNTDTGTKAKQNSYIKHSVHTTQTMPKLPHPRQRNDHTSQPKPITADISLIKPLTIKQENCKPDNQLNHITPLPKDIKQEKCEPTNHSNSTIHKATCRRHQTEVTSFYKLCLERLPRHQDDNQRPSLLTEQSSKLAPAFTSEKFRKFLITHGIQPLLTTSNNPQANGLIERLNATITGKLRLAYLENPKASWTQLVKRVTQTYNSTPHSVTSFPPTYIMFNVVPPDLRTHLNPYPEITRAREIARSRTQNKHKKDKETFDKQHRTPHFEVNDLVLVKNYRHPDTDRDKEIKDLINALTKRLDSWGERLESRLSAIDDRVENINQRLQQLEESSAVTKAALSQNSKKIKDLEDQLEYLDAKSRERNLIFYGIEQDNNEDCRERIRRVIEENMRTTEKINITRCHRVSRKPGAPILVEVPEQNDRSTLFKAAFNLRGTKISLSKDYSMKMREQRRVLNVKRRELVEKEQNLTNLLRHIDYHMSEGNEVLIAGDINIRIGNAGGFHNPLKLNSPLNKYRKSKDLISSKLSEKLISFTDSNSITIANGRTKGDTHGSFTFISERGSSVLDYFMYTHGLTQIISDMWIEELSYSDHLPIVLQINTGYEAIKSSYKNEILTRKFIWTKGNVEMLKHNLSDIEVGNETDINTETVNFTKQIYTAMESANIIKFAKRRHQLSKPWYDKDCYIMKKTTKGESLSPLLFILYMADLIELYNNSALTGFHLPDFGVLHLLMYADDIAIIGESKINLQIKINLLKSYLDKNKLVLKENKSKIMVFRNGGRPARHENCLTDAYEETWTHPDIDETIAEFECSPRPLLDAECGQLGLLLHQLDLLLADPTSLVKPTRSIYLFWRWKYKPWTVVEGERESTEVQQMGRDHEVANVVFYLNGTSGRWFDNNEESLNSWRSFEDAFRGVFRLQEDSTRRGEKVLKSRAQKAEKSCESYIQEILSLCNQGNPHMEEGEIVDHIIKRISEHTYQVLVAKDIQTVLQGAERYWKTLHALTVPRGYYRFDPRLHHLITESRRGTTRVNQNFQQIIISDSRQDNHNEGYHNEEGKKTVQIGKSQEQRWRNKHAIPTKRPSNLPSTTQPKIPQNKPVRSYPPSALQRNHPDDMPPSPNRSHKLLQALHGTPSTSSGQQPKTNFPD
ncbi:hypothetical protein LAZ67_4001293 [Cordylochernes scorpioides]|uniref:RNA-directed DNA polymerase n=1 Tax=Cordylochernes scorpioides TaxID=51811 RepID=A0ABY6KET8_9ARAC|nr:hypothetical protein LAZ67_4001293 [Cordylochernes scorpioides]